MTADVSRLTARLNALEPAGRMIPRLKSSSSCYVCRRKIEGSARLLWPGAPTCSYPKCEMLSAAEIGELFSTQYGRAVDTWTLRIFCVCKDGPSIVVERASIVDRAGELAGAFVDLTTWQWAYDSWMQVHHQEAWRLGKTIVIPPRRLEEVRKIRLRGAWQVVDPTAALPSDIRSEISEIRSSGPKAVEAPF